MTVLAFPMQQSLPDYVARLNPPQAEAVVATDGPLLVLAGAGTGKTRVLTTRIAHLLMTKKAWPSQILSVTFTNKAAREMTNRVQKLLFHAFGEESGNPADSTQGMWLGTFHSIAARILRRHAEALGLTSSFTILDTDDQLRLLKALMAEKNIDHQRFPPKQAMNIIQGWKDRGLTPEKVGATYLDHFGAQQAHSIYADYQRRLIQVNACDFGDLLMHNLTLFQSRPEILADYTRRFKYILVDEYQDTNVGQYLWLRLLAMEHRNICCVGDDDQSIYGWRGAEVGNILKFEKDYPDAKVVRLEQNYRSTPHILGAASGLISNNKGRLGKTLWTESDIGERVRIKATWDDGEEARFVGEEVEARQRAKVSLAEIAVLIRAGFQTRLFEERFLTLGVPYRVVGGLRFYERMEIRDAIAYLRAVSQPRDDLAFERIINTPKRGIGKTTLEQMHIRARADNASLQHATLRLLEDGQIKGKAQFALGQFFRQMETWRKQASEISPATLIELILDEAGYTAMWAQEKTPEAQGRLENLKELYRALAEFPTVEAFLEHVSLVMDVDDKNTDAMVSIMTLHAAKGLEFDTVFLCGWEEGLFPHQRALDESGATGLEEERRLAYVGITRAKELLYITHAGTRRIYNNWQSSIPSRFLTELPGDHVEHLDGGGAGMSARSPQLFQKNIDAILAEGQRMAPPKADDSYLGKRVFHMKFGYGTVLVANGSNLEIFFEKSGRKKVMADYVERVK